MLQQVEMPLVPWPPSQQTGMPPKASVKASVSDLGMACMTCDFPPRSAAQLRPFIVDLPISREPKRSGRPCKEVQAAIAGRLSSRLAGTAKGVALLDGRANFDTAYALRHSEGWLCVDVAQNAAERLGLWRLQRGCDCWAAIDRLALPL